MPLLSRILKSVLRLDQALSVWICALLFCFALGESAAQPAPLEAKLQLDTATKAAAQGRNDEARSAYENARSLFQANKNRLGEAYALDGLGDLDRKQERNDPARKNYLEARGLFQAVGERMGEANVLYALGELDRSLSRHDEARKAYTDALRLYQAAHSRQGQADALRGLGELDLALGRHDDARKSFDAALSLYRALTNRLSEAHALKGLGHLDRAAGRGDDARKSYEEASRLYRAEQNPLGEANVLLGLGYLDRTLGRYDDARRNFRDAAINYGLAGMGEQQRKANALALSDANSPPESAKQQASLASPVSKVALVALAVIALSGIAAVALRSRARTSMLAPSDSRLCLRSTLQRADAGYTTGVNATLRSFSFTAFFRVPQAFVSTIPSAGRTFWPLTHAPRPRIFTLHSTTRRQIPGFLIFRRLRKSCVCSLMW